MNEGAEKDWNMMMIKIRYIISRQGLRKRIVRYKKQIYNKNNSEVPIDIHIKKKFFYWFDSNFSHHTNRMGYHVQEFIII